MKLHIRSATSSTCTEWTQRALSKVRVWRLLYLSMKALAVSCITNMATGIQTVKHSHARVLEIANQSWKILCRWLGAVIRKIKNESTLEI